MVDAPIKEFKDALIASHAVITYELDLLGRQKCKVCEGFGHSKFKCPTHGKLTNLSKGGNCPSVLVGCLRTIVDGK